VSLEKINSFLFPDSIEVSTRQSEVSTVVDDFSLKFEFYLVNASK